MALTRLVAGSVFGVKFTAGRWANVIDRTTDRNTNFASQRHATGRAGISATQADDGWRYRHRHFERYALPPGEGTTGQFGRMKIDTQTGATGAATLADAHGKITRQRHNSWPEARYFFSKGVIGSSVCHASATTGWPLSKLSARAISSM